MDVVALLGRNVRRHREAPGLSQEQLALEAGMKRSYLSELGKGVRNPSVRALGPAGRGTSMPLDVLLRHDEGATR